MTAVVFSEAEIWRVRFPLRLAFSHNLASRKRVDTIILALKTAGGNFGYGQALPRAYLTGESLETVAEDLAELWLPALSAMTNPGEKGHGGIESAFAALRPLHEAAQSQRKLASFAAFESAFLDGYAKEIGLPLSSVAHTEYAPASLPLVGVIAASSPRKVAWLARFYRWLGYSRFKVKVGTDREADEKRLHAIRAVVGSSAWISVDANQAWSMEEADDRVPALKQHGVQLVEEPLRADCISEIDFSRLEARWGMAVMADETVCSINDGEKLIAVGSPSWWNLRVAKNGGLTGVSALAEMARRHGVRLYGGILVGETSLLSTIGRVAMFSVGTECGEYGFPRFFLKGDPFRGASGGRGGAFDAPSGMLSGFGVSLRKEKLKKMSYFYSINKMPFLRAIS